VQDDAYILTLTRYLHLNPVKVRVMKTAEKGERIQCLEKYAWSSYRGYVNQRRREDWVCYEVLRVLDENCRVAGRRYRAYVYGCLIGDDGDLKRAQERSGHGIGDEEFVKELERELRERKSGSDRDRDVDYPTEVVATDRIDEAVAQEFGTTVEALKAHGHTAGAGLAKVAALDLACRLTDLTQREVGARYGGISSQAVSLARKRAKSPALADRLVRLAGVLQGKA
jgi:hypothetical protein